MKQNIVLKFIQITSLIIAAVPGCFAQTSTKNYITSYRPQVAVTNEWALPGLSKEDGQKSITYFDGLGRPEQQIQVAGSPLGYDVVTPVKYDVFGRQVRKFLPYSLTSANSGSFVASDSTAQSSYFTGLFGSTDGTNAFAKTEFEPSPLNRPLKQGAPGGAWQPNTVAGSDRSVKINYGTNLAADSVRLWTINSGNTPVTTSYYPVNSLYKTITWDENNNKDLSTSARTEEYKDQAGSVVLKRVCEGSKKYSTYYVYDNLKLLRFVLPPKAFADFNFTLSTAKLNDLCYQYRYNDRNLMVKKKLPGADSISMVYDARDRLVLSQDGILRPLNKWYFTKYDLIDRPVFTGCVLISITNPDTIRARFKRYVQTPTTSLYESKLSTGNIGYTPNNSYPTSVVSAIAETDILTITYYDDYSHLAISGFSPLAYNSSYDIDNYTDNDGNNDGYFDKVKGQVTGTKIKVLDGNEYTASAKWLCSANYYDDRYRVIQSCRAIYHGTSAGKEILSSQYDFTGKLTKSKNVQFFGANTNTVTETNTFDHLERLKLVKHLINTGTEVTLASLDYNESGQLKQKSLHGAVGSGIQNLNYTYNIRGWLTKINNPDVNPSLTSLQKLNLGLFYNTVPTGLTAGAQYNGNISAVAWNTPLQTGALSPADKQGYGFTYDGLNRMLTSTYGEGTTFATNAGVNNENVTYDLNGNIKTLTRYLKGTGLIDNLTYTYKDGNVSNTLDRVDDAVTGSQGFSESVKQANEYGYDVNGNLTSDANKGYTSILYNYLNLPRRIGTASQYISYFYDAAGTKLAKIGTANDTTYYAGSFIYSGSSLNYILHREGMYLPGGNYQYYLKDHLGNTRLVVNTVGTGGTIVQQTDYYPFGMDIASYNGGLDNNYRYNGKEFQNDVINSRNLQWYDYGARFYDLTIARFSTVDPHADKYYNISPYAYCLNNPLRYIDPNGKDGDVEINKDKIKISVSVYIYGSGASDKQATKMQTAIMSDWNKGSSYTDSKTGQKYAVSFDVKVQVYNKDNPKEGPGLFSDKNNPFSTSNFIEVGATPKDIARSYVSGGDEGQWRGYGSDPSSHEFGHLIGLRDHYSDANGTEAGWKGNVMAEPAGRGKVQQKNIDAVASPLINKYRESGSTTNTYKTKIDENNPSW